MWWTCKQIDADHPQLHTLLKLLPCIGEFVGFWFLVFLFFETTKVRAAAIMTAIGFGIAYGVDISLLHADLIWSLGAGALGALLGYLSGEVVAKEVAEKS